MVRFPVRHHGNTFRGRAAARAIAVSTGVLLASCGGDIVDPEASPSSAADSPWTLEYTPFEPLRLVGDTLECPGVQNCNITEDPASGNDLCMCELSGFLVNPDDPPSVPPPAWPPPFPGWYEPGDWDEGSSDPGGDPGEGQPCDFGCPIEVSASLACSVGVTRGEVGSCKLTVEPAEQLDKIHRWVLESDAGGMPIVLENPGPSLTWQGPVVTSGAVRVVITVGGSDVVVGSRLTVSERPWSWSPGSGIIIHSGGLSWPPGVTSIGRTCRPEACTTATIMQPQNSFGHGNGYTRATVLSGPNKGLWYVAGVTANIHMASAINPDYSPGGVKYPATGSDAVACGANASDTVPRSFVEYNEQCRFQPEYLVPWESWVWNHEDRHMLNAVAYVETYIYPKFDAPRVLESIVHRTSMDLDAEVTARLSDMPHCIQSAAATHGHLGGFLQGFPANPLDIYLWGSNAFYMFPQGSVTWNAGSANHLQAPCSEPL